MVVILARLIVGYPIPKRPDGKKQKKIALAQSTNNKKCQPDRQYKIKTNMAATKKNPKSRNKEDQESPVRQAGDVASASDSMNNTSEYVIEKYDNCVSCGKVVTEADNCAECQWCSR